MGAAILLKHGICAEELSERLKASSYTEKNVQSDVITFLRKAVLAANRCGCPTGTAHLLFVLLEKEAEGARTLLKECGADLIQIKESCAAELRALESVFSGRKPTAARMPRELTLYTTDLTALAREEKLDPLIGREEEVEEVLSVLARRTKNNPCLLGEAWRRQNSDSRRGCTAICRWSCRPLFRKACAFAQSGRNACRCKIPRRF